MGQCTNGQICYGVEFEEEHEFPWLDEKFDDGIHDWWREVKGFKPMCYPYDADGNYLPGIDADDTRVEVYYHEREMWDAVNPLPIVDVNVCSGDYPVLVLAVPGTVREAFRGSPEKFKPEALVVDPEKLVKFTEFLNEFDFQGKDSPGWYLSSYWG